MTFRTDAIYEGGVLRPLAPLNLKEHEVVSLSISTAAGQASPENQAVRQPPDAFLKPQDQWEQRLLGIAKDCGVSLPDSAVSSEGLYE